MNRALVNCLLILFLFSATSVLPTTSSLSNKEKISASLAFEDPHDGTYTINTQRTLLEINKLEPYSSGTTSPKDSVIESVDDDDNTGVGDPIYSPGSTILSAASTDGVPTPNAPSTRHLRIIDAGSGGSRLHVYEFEERRFTTLPPPLSDVTTDSRWTSRLKPGISSFASVKDEKELFIAMGNYLKPLIDFAKLVLAKKEHLWSDTRLYLKATGGMRTLSHSERERTIGVIRRLFRNDLPSFDKENGSDEEKNFEWDCPFQFSSDEQARIISGEEEAIYGWTAINYLMGTLYSNTHGFGTVSSPNRTYGALDMGGASTQISFFESTGDIVANLFKMQLGSAKHWNIYAHSFLYYGVNLARERLGAKLSEGKTTEQLLAGVFVPCLPSGFNVSFTSKIHFDRNDIESWQSFSSVGKDAESYDALFLGQEDTDDISSFDLCMDYTKSLLRLESNAWCNFAHGGDCSYAGIYQPPLPRQGIEGFGEFFAFANYLHIWKFGKLPIKCTVKGLGEKAREICGMSYDELIVYNNGVEANLELLHQYCFLTSYAYSMLHYGYGFNLNDNITVANVINGQKVGWVLGSTLYEINTLDWTYVGDEITKQFGAGFGGIIVFLTTCCVVLSWELFKKKSGRGMSVWSEDSRHMGYGAVDTENA